ncbi:HMO1 [Candida oxycetoniae]|uniref:HMO1 n=1 Tax=Candida oxycetoniae TaxID=497107 RepID=A0AAI9WY77_9ASCO|nr:HMO1 [Candida oxycetoniae]KAI3404997.1 HMO1 [Candida oxycetoniae]
MTSELRTTKDVLVSSLFELSKAAQEAANAAVDFYRVATGGEEDVTTEQLHQIQEAMKIAVSATTGIKRELPQSNVNGNEKVKKKKVERDPNAPKKPLTMFFAFSFHLRKLIAEERKKKDLPNLSAIDMNSMIKDRWDNITSEEKARWKQKYDDEMKTYNLEKAKYEQSLKDGSYYKAPPAPYASGYTGPNPVLITPRAEEIVEEDDDEEEIDEPVQIPILSQEEKERKKKKKAEKKEKKKKLAFASQSPH